MKNDIGVKPNSEFVWKEWSRNKTQLNATPLLDAFRPMIHREVNRQKGVLPQSFLEVKAKQLAFDAFDNFDPDRGTRLSTYVASRLKGLARENYTYQNALRMPEAQQRAFGTFMSAKRTLEEKLDREPSTAEMSEALSWPIKEVGRMEKNIHNEVPEFKTVAEGKGGDIAAWTPDDAVVDYLYHDMTPEDKIIFEAITGYGGHPILSIKDLSESLRLSESQIRRRREKLVAKIQEAVK